MDEPDKKIFKIIVNDVMRTQPEMLLFREPVIQKLMERLLYIWNMRHP